MINSPTARPLYVLDVRGCQLMRRIAPVDVGFEEDLMAKGWVRRRGRSTVFVNAEVETGKTLAQGNMAYRIVR